MEVRPERKNSIRGERPHGFLIFTPPLHPSAFIILP